MTSAVILSALVSLASMIACPIIASKKGRNPVGWFFIGLLLSGIGLICALVVKEK